MVIFVSGWNFKKSYVLLNFPTPSSCSTHMLSSGGILYKAVDPFSRPAGVAINCEHAICDIALNPGERKARA